MPQQFRSRFPWSALAINLCILLAGYCFGGRIGLGIAALLVAFIQMI